MALSTEVGNGEQQIQQELRDAGSFLAMGAEAAGRNDAETWHLAASRLQSL